MRVFADRIERLSPAKRALLDKWRQSTSSNSASLILPRADRSCAPLSFAQQRLWFLGQLEPQSPLHHVATVIRLIGCLDASALEQALRAVIARHDALRTTFHLVDGHPRQIVAPYMHWCLERHELDESSAAQREARWRQLARSESVRPFDLESGPLIRGTLVRVGPDDHVLLLTLHHIICDGWSMAVLRREVAEFYEAQVSGKAARLEPLDIQYADFAVWQREQLVEPALKGSLDYWSRKLARRPDPLELPFDYARPPRQTFGGDVRRLSIGAPLTEALRRVGREQDATLFMVLLAAWNALLSRYTGQRDICVGSPIANRTHIQLERLIGFFVNTLVLRTDLAANPTVRQLLAQVRQATLDAYAHQDLPFARVVEQLKPERDLGRTPLFQVLFVLQNIPIETRNIAGLTVSEVSFDHAPIANFDLTLNIDEHSDRLDLSLVYNTALFLPQTIDQMIESYRVLLAEFCGDLDRSVLTLPVYPRAAQAVSPREPPCPASATPDCDACFPALFAEQVRCRPAALALVTPDETLTYRELDKRSTRLARRLAAHGVGPDSAVGICLDRSAELIVSLLGTLKAGGAYVPLDPQYPPARLEYMARDAGLKLLVTTAELAPRIGRDEIATVLIDAECASVSRENSEPFVGPATARDLAYIIYTSGSTGEPKGVEIEHRSLVNHAFRFAEQIGLTAGDRMLQFLSPSFDAAGEEIFPTLARGATLCLHPAPAELSGAALLDWSRQQSVNILHLTPAIWLSLLEEISLRGPDAARHLKAVVAGGDSVRREDAARWQRVTAGRIPFYLAYGVTEATITTTMFSAVGELGPTMSGNLPIGCPLANTRIYVLDEFQQPVPAGVRGEIYLGGVGVARGYRNRRELTTERFRADPFEQRAGARMYRTGDCGRFLHDDSVEFLGRLDRQIKVRGYRVEPGEVEATLCQHARVCEASVVALGDASAARLHAYVALAPGALETETDLERFLAGRLPAHLIPASITILDVLPRLPGGKIDYAALPRPQRARQPNTLVTAPRNEIEQVLADVWASVLDVADVGIHDNFFEIGGDSIRGIQVVARARDRGLRLTPKQLFEHQTIAELALVAERAASVRAEQGPVTGPVPLTPIQHEFFAFELNDPHHFNQSVLLELTRGTPPAALDAALRQLVAHHDALRLRFQKTPDGSWQQSGMPINDRPLLEYVDLSSAADISLDAAITNHAAIVQSGLDLETGRLVRAAYFDLGASRPARLLIVVHHLAIDTVSWRILLEDLGAICLQLAEGRPALLPAKTTSFADWSRRLVDFADSETVLAERERWIADVSSMASLVHRHEAIVDKNQVATEDVIEASLSPEATAKWLYECHTAYRTRPHELLIAALADTLARESGSGIVAIDLEGHGRENPFDDIDLSRTVGWFTALYPCVLRRLRTGRLDDLILTVKEQLRAIGDGGLSYGLLRWLAHDLKTRNTLAGAARNKASFNYLGQLDTRSSADALFVWTAETAGPSRSPRGVRPHAWEIIAYVREDRLRVQWRYSNALHERSQIQQLVDDFVAAIHRLIDHCLDPRAGQVSPQDFPLAELDQQDLDQLTALLDDRDDSETKGECR